jgi:hypothetical protein
MIEALLKKQRSLLPPELKKIFEHNKNKKLYDTRK